ncbi:MAG: aldehyde dehydrogenase family protein, partial [Cellulomonadaceae bacterium]|nr:aldehyde dehydrogenase family protein [Cellulomonadaceae bacterium]
MTTQVSRPIDAQPELPDVERILARAAVAPGRDRHPHLSPIDGRLLAHVPHGTPDDVVAAVDAARHAQRAWAARPMRERTDVLLAFHDLLLTRQLELLDLTQLETGKARVGAFEELI